MKSITTPEAIAMQTSSWWTRFCTATWFRFVAWNDRLRQRDWERLDATYKQQIQEAWHKAHDTKPKGPRWPSTS